MSPALRDCLEQLSISTEGAARFDPLFEDILKLVLVEGVKVGGIYQHWKGKEYIVKGISRDADNWDQFFVTYYERTDATHEATRKLEWFLGDMNDERHTGPRFRLVG